MRRVISARMRSSGVTAICAGGQRCDLGQNVLSRGHGALAVGPDGEDLDETSHLDAPWFSRTVEQRKRGYDNPFQQRPFRPDAGEDANPHEHPEKMMGKRDQPPAKMPLPAAPTMRGFDRPLRDWQELSRQERRPSGKICSHGYGTTQNFR
jgi:hypothetical protein